MSWLVPFSSLTPEQQDAVSLDDKHHKAIIGGPGAGKSMVLLYRFDNLYNLYNKEVDSIHFFVYTTSLKDFIKSSFSLLDIPDNCITTFDKWCLDTYKKYINYSVPYTQSGKSKKPDFEKIRSTVHEQITTGKIKIPLFKAILIDEAQDMDQQAVEIICSITKHVTVAMDGKQQLYDDRLAESGVLQLLNMKRHNVSLLSAYRCNPMVTNLAANFIDDIDKRNEFKRQAKNGKGDRYKPLFYIASGFDDEKKRLAELIHLRLSNNETIGILFPQKRLVYGYAKGLKELGIDIDTDSPRNGLDFSNGRPKALTYHEAKGLTFDSVFMPKLDTDAFTNKMSDRLKSLLFVGVSRAVSWVYLSGIERKLIDVAANLCNEYSKEYLEIQRYNITDTSNSNQAELLDDNWLDDVF